MQWWNDFVDWFGSRDGQIVLFSAIIPFVAILVAGIVAAAIGRGSTKRLLTLNDRENRVAAVATMIGAARRASVWNTLGAPEQQHADHIASEADVRVRLLAVPGSGLAADWASHELAAMKRDSVSFSFQAEQSLIEFRERMVQWQAKPSRAKKLFKNDLDLWAYEDSQATKDIITQQQAWAASQVASETGPITTVQQNTVDAVATPAPTTAAANERAASSFAPQAADSSPSRPSSPSRSSVSIAALAGDRKMGDRSAEDRKADDDESGGREPGGRESGGREETQAPALVEPEARSRPDDDDSLGDEAEGRPSDPVYSPVNANSVARRINPPTVGDDGRKY